MTPARPTPHLEILLVKWSKVTSRETHKVSWLFGRKCASAILFPSDLYSMLMSQACTRLPMLHWETLVRLNFKISRTSGKVVARRVHPVGTDLLNRRMVNLSAQAPAQLQAPVPAQSSRESTMWVIIPTKCIDEIYVFFPHVLRFCRHLMSFFCLINCLDMAIFLFVCFF